MSKIQRCYELTTTLLEKGDEPSIREELDGMDAADIAELLPHFDKIETQVKVFLLNSNQTKRADILAELDDHHQAEFAENIDPDELAPIIEEMASDDATDFLSEIEQPELSKEILSHTESEFQKDINRLMTFDEESGGGIMTSELCAFPDNLSVEDVLNSLQPENLKDPVMYIYVIDAETKQFIGAISLINLVHADQKESIGSIAEPSSVWATVDEDREKIAAKFRKYNLWVMPVLDDRNHIVGRITVDDILEISIEEADEDIAIMTGTSEAVTHDAGLPEAIRLRLPWLVVTLLLALVNAFVIGHFLKSLDQFIVLAAFPAVIAAMGGNTGMQAATVFIRELALETILPEDFKSLVLRESLSGLIMGIFCGLIAGAIAFIGIPLLYGMNNKLDPFILAKIIFFSVGLAMATASILGTMTPIILRRVGIDPAVAAGPIVTTLNDIISSVIYFLTAMFLLDLFL